MRRVHLFWVHLPLPPAVLLLLSILSALPASPLAAQAPPASPPAATAQAQAVVASPLATEADDPPASPPSHTYFRLLLDDAQAVLGAPAHWQGREWGLFALSVTAVGAAALADGSVRSSERHDHSAFADHVARDFEPLGSGGAFGVLGAFYLVGLVGHDDGAKGVAEDGLAASLIAGGILTPALKYLAGRSRPRDTTQTFDFKPFSGAASFPSGHATEAFAVASVVAYEYKSPWVQAVSYGSAALVGFARIHHQAHFLSDVTAGALIGAATGRTVARVNHARRSHFAVAPLVGPHQESGVVAVLDF